MGWYLMVPRPYPDNPLPNYEAPITEWDRYGDFAAKEDCEAKKTKMFKEAVDLKTCTEIDEKVRASNPGKQTDPSESQEDFCLRLQEYLNVAKCVSNGDPGFGGKIPPRSDHCCSHRPAASKTESLPEP